MKIVRVPLRATISLAKIPGGELVKPIIIDNLRASISSAGYPGCTMSINVSYKTDERPRESSGPTWLQHREKMTLCPDVMRFYDNRD